MRVDSSSAAAVSSGTPGSGASSGAASGAASGSGSAPGSGSAADVGASLKLTAQQKALVAKLVATDEHVRAHEQAHLAAAGGYATSGASFTYERGPDGEMYAVGGEVSIDASPIPGDPQATIRKAETVREAALAPVDPSDQDRAVASAASQMEVTAQRELDRMQASAWLNRAPGGGNNYAQPPAASGTLLSIVA
jgi:hypothetical protein